MNHLIDPHGMGYLPDTGPVMEMITWLTSPDGGALRMEDAYRVARAIALGEVPHVTMMTGNPIVVDCAPAVITTDGGRTWTKIELAGPNDSVVTHGEWMEVDGKRIPLAEYLSSYQHTLGKSK